jgi:hypothetical protein
VSSHGLMVRSGTFAMVYSARASSGRGVVVMGTCGVTML